MKILFLCGSLENGRDGVGDYSRRLAGEVKRQGHDVKIISLNEKHLKETVEELQGTEQELIQVLRLPSDLPWDNRIEAAKTFVKTFDPDWISLQYVPFAYEDRGLPFGLSKKLLKLGAGIKFHIMFHELWLGIDKEASLKMKIWGVVQKQLILQMIRSVAPGKIHTQSQVYKAVLKENKVKAGLLRLFSNIPKIQSSKKESSNFNCILFGGVHDGAPIERFVEEIKSFSLQKNVPLVFYFVGRNGNAVTKWIEAVEKANIKYHNIGETDSTNISDLLSKADIGISTTPYYLTEKSGTIAAMLDHGLPVICVSYNWSPQLKESIPTIHKIYNYNPAGHNSFEFEKVNEHFDNDLQKIASQFIEELL